MDKKIVRGGFCKSYPDGFSVRHMTKEEAKIVIDWYTYICATSVDLEVAFDALGTEMQAFVGDMEGNVIASVVRAPVTDTILYGSLYYVEEKYRSQGLFKRLRDEVADEFVEGRIICIDAHDELIPLYKRRGFTDAFDITHYTGPVIKGDLVKPPPDIVILPFTDSLFDELMCYDDQCFVSPGSVQRRKLIELWVQIKGGLTMVAVDGGGKGKVVGMVSRRPAVRPENNHVVGPLYAENYNIARCLMSAVTEEISGHTIWITVSSLHKDAVKLVTELKLKDDIHMRRMYLNGQLSPPNEKVFAITSIDICGF